MFMDDGKMKLRFIQVISRYPLVRAVLYPILLPRRAFLRAWFPRRVLEHAQKTLFAEAPLLSVPEFEGVFRIGTQSDLFARLILRGSYEPVLANLCRRLVDPVRDVVDVGANIGFYTVLSAKHIHGRVLAVEPTDNALSLLRQNIDRNSVMPKVIVFEGVASDVMGELTLNFVGGREEYSSIGAIKHPAIDGVACSQKMVVSSTLDQLVEQHGLDPGFVKIDVEGAEHKVLAGATSVLTKARPVLMSEFSPHLLRSNGADPDKLIRSLRDKGYRLIDPGMPKLVVGRREFGDLIGVPEERYSEAELAGIVADVHGW